MAAVPADVAVTVPSAATLATEAFDEAHPMDEGTISASPSLTGPSWAEDPNETLKEEGERVGETKEESNLTDRVVSVAMAAPEVCEPRVLAKHSTQ